MNEQVVFTLKTLRALDEARRLELVDLLRGYCRGDGETTIETILPASAEIHARHAELRKRLVSQLPESLEYDEGVDWDEVNGDINWPGQDGAGKKKEDS